MTQIAIERCERGSWVTAALAVQVMLAVLLTAGGAGFAGEGTGEAVFAPGVRSEFAQTLDVAFGDVDGDGHVDAVCGWVEEQTFFRGNGDGTFVKVGPAGVAEHPMGLSDQNGDGILDLFFGRDYVAIAIGNGDGTFTWNGSLVQAPGFPGSFRSVVADLDGVPPLDVIAIATGDPFFQIEGGVGFFLGQPDGTLAMAHGFVVDGSGPSAVVGDFDEDGYHDVVLIQTYFQEGRTPTLQVWLGGETDPFTTSLPAMDAGDGGMPACADFDGDGHLDVVLVDRFDGRLELFVGRGDGTFEAPVPGAAFDGFPTSVEAVDVTGDGRVDLVAHSFDQSRAIVYRNDASEGLVPSVPIEFGDESTTFMHVADVNGDARPDVAAGIIDIEGGFVVATNATYPTEGPVRDLGHALPGEEGHPILLVDGTFEAGDPYEFVLHRAASSASISAVAGYRRVDRPTRGGVLVPAPDRVKGPFVANETGVLELSGTFRPMLPPGTELFVQFWWRDAGGELGWAASTAVAITIP